MSTETTLYSCGTHRPVRIAKDVGSDRQAAEHFAAVKARKRYGRSARVAALNITGWSPADHNGTRFFEVSAFIGRPNRQDRNATDGENVNICVWAHSPN